MSTVATPPPIAQPSGPAPGPAYNPGEHTPSAPAPKPNARLSDALNRIAGNAPAQSTTPEPNRILPSQPPRAPIDAPAPEKPAPHVKFITPDEREVSPPAPAAPPAAPVAGEPTAEVMKSAPAQLRDAYERLKADFANRATEGDLTKKELATYRAKATSYEDRIKVLEGADERAKALEKEVLTKDELIRVTAYTQSDEYHNTYEKPVAEATQSAYSLVKDLLVTGEDGQMRTGTPQDFQTVLGQPNHTLAMAKAKELFGDDFGNQVFQATIEVRKALGKRAKALEEAGARSLEYAKSQSERAASSRAQAREAFDRAATELDTKYPGLYTAPPEDTEAKAARAKGEELARMVIVDGKPADMPGERFLSEAAKVYHRAAAWPKDQLAISRLQTELAETKSRLSEYERSSPGVASRQQPGGVKTDAGGAIVTERNGDLRAKMHESLERRARGVK